LGLAVDGAGSVFLTGAFEGSVDLGGGVLLSAGDSDLFIAKFDANGNHVWSKRGGNSALQQGNVLVADALGNVILAGNVEGSITLGGDPLTSAGAADVLLAKFDGAGNHLWSHVFGDASDQSPHGIAITNDGSFFVTGMFQGVLDFGAEVLSNVGDYDMFLAKFEPAGEGTWSKQFGNEQQVQVAADVSVDPAGNVAISGDVRGSVDFGGGPLQGQLGYGDIFVAQFDAVGSHLWSESFPSAGVDSGRVAFDPAGNVLLSGRFEDDIDFGGGVLVATNQPLTPDTFVAKFSGASNIDSDGDGCTDVEETSMNPARGGMRDRTLTWDFFDVPVPATGAGTDGQPFLTMSSVRNKAVSLQDVGVVLAYVGRASSSVYYSADNNGDGLGDGTQLDRTPSTVPTELWHSGPPNGAISLQDVGVALSQAGHSCIAPP
jgi:hypothetical protein